jgi:hypothetical protein
MVMDAQNESEWKTALHHWVDSLSLVPKSEKDTIPISKIKVKADYDKLFNPEYFNSETIEKLEFILDEAWITNNHLIIFSHTGNFAAKNGRKCYVKCSQISCMQKIRNNTCLPV